MTSPGQAIASLSATPWAGPVGGQRSWKSPPPRWPVFSKWESAKSSISSVRLYQERPNTRPI